MIETKRLIIRSFTAEDAKDLYEYLSHPEVVRYEPYEPYSLADCIKIAEERAQNSAFFAVCLKESGKMIGNIYFSKQEFEAFELGYVFNHTYQGCGYASESAAALIGRAFEKENAHRIFAMCNPQNKNSWRLLERLGFRREAHFVKDIYFKTDSEHHPIWQDTYVYALLIEDWLSVKNNLN